MNEYIVMSSRTYNQYANKLSRAVFSEDGSECVIEVSDKEKDFYTLIIKNQAKSRVEFQNYKQKNWSEEGEA